MTQAPSTQRSPSTSKKTPPRQATRRILNIRLLIVTAVIAGVCGSASLALYQYRANQTAGTLLQRAAALEDEEKWPEAAGYLARYLQLEPTDIDARLRLIDVVEKSAVTVPGRYRLVSLLYQTVGAIPERSDLRLKLAQQLLDLRDYNGSEEQSRKLLESKDASQQAAARRIIALSLRARAREDGVVSLKQAADALATALADNPGDVLLASLTAELYREQPDEVGPLASPAHADEIMNRLVAADDHNVDARLARYQYRRRYSLPNAQEDLDVALATGGDRSDVLLLAAEADFASGDQERRQVAHDRLDRSIELEPADPRGYIGLAQWYLASQDQAQAADTLMRGRMKLAEPSLDLDYLLSGLLVDLGRLDDAKIVAAEFDEQFRSLLPNLTTAGRIKIENMNRLVQARLAFAEKDFGRAVRESEAIVASMDKAGDQAQSMELLDAYALLATVETQANRPDLAVANWTLLANRAPGFRDAALKAGLINLLLGRTDKALVQLERYGKVPNASPQVVDALVQARLQEQLARPVALRDWQQFLAAVNEARTKIPNQWEWRIAEVAYFTAQGSDSGRQAAIDRLKELEKSFANDVSLNERLAIIYQQLGRKDDARRVIDHYDTLSSTPARRAMLRASLFVGDKRPDEALQLLTSAAASSSSPQERRELDLARTKILLLTGKSDEAQQVIAALIADSPADVQLLAQGIEIAMQRGDLAAADSWAEGLKRGSQADDFDWRYFRARRLVADFSKLDDQQQRELDQLVESLRAQRPDWPPVMALAGQYAELHGDRKAAIDAYRAALAAGDRRPQTLELLVRALYAEGRFDEATRYLSQAGSDEKVQGRFESLAIAAALQGNRLSEARELAQQAIDRGSKDPLHFLLLANLLLTDGDRKGAENTFRTALQQFPRDGRVWNGLFAYFVQTEQLDKAKQALQRWTDSVPMDEVNKQLILGQGQEALGNVEAATKCYEAVIELQADNTPARLRLGKLLLANDATAARKQFEQVLRVDPNQSEAKQYLAALLAATGDDSDWSKAEQLLKQSTSGTNDVAADGNDRLRAILLTRKGKNQTERLANYAEARRILTARLEQSGSANADYDVDRMLLAGIYEQEAKLTDAPTLIESARDVLRPLVDRPNPSVDHLTFYIQLLMRNIDGQKSGNRNATANDAASVYLADVRNRISDLEDAVEKQPNDDRRILPVALRVKLLTLEGQPAEGHKLIDQWTEQQLAAAKDDPARAKVYLQAGKLCATAGFPEEAEQWYRKLVTIVPNGYVLVAQALLEQGKPDAAVDFCIEVGKKMPSATVATVLAQILTQEKDSPDLDRKARPLIDAALDEDRGNVNLLMAVAVQRVTRNDTDSAAQLFQRVVTLQPNNTLALNNLATLYAERPDRLEKAQQYVEQAIAVSGRNPALLDTLGTILVRAGKYGEAVAALEEAVAGTASDPRYYFHLAAAYEGANRREDAQKALHTATELGLDNAILTTGDRELLASLKHVLLASTAQD